MRKKLHFACVEFPLIEGLDITAGCGEVVKKARIAMVWDSAEMGQAVPLIRGACRECGIGDERFVYGIISGEQL